MTKLEKEKNFYQVQKYINVKLQSCIQILPKTHVIHSEPLNTLS